MLFPDEPRLRRWESRTAPTGSVTEVTEAHLETRPESETR